mmetsp:Transcript_77758/g.207729  ORF Transcript_77758/g.207729 Transcript_77758/m.207729 type:complete len:200 (+) Transcript_77758:349-948(+)
MSIHPWSCTRCWRKVSGKPSGWCRTTTDVASAAGTSWAGGCELEYCRGSIIAGCAEKWFAPSAPKVRASSLPWMSKSKLHLQSRATCEQASPVCLGTAPPCAQLLPLCRATDPLRGKYDRCIPACLGHSLPKRKCITGSATSAWSRTSPSRLKINCGARSALQLFSGLPRLATLRHVLTPSRKELTSTPLRLDPRRTLR